MMILPLLLSLILFILGLVHFNWVFGGTFGFAESLPTKETGERILNAKKIDSALVGIGLIAFGFFYVFESGLINYSLPQGILEYSGWIIQVIFLLRAMGDFKYVGFFKKVKKTTFGKLDSRLFSPLCLVIGILGIVIQLGN